MDLYTALYGTLFANESEAAFSNYRLWESLGFVAAFAYSFYLCAAVKIYILTVALVIGMIGYVAAEFLHRKTSVSAAGAGDISNNATTSSGRQETVDEKLVLLRTYYPCFIIHFIVVFFIEIRHHYRCFSSAILITSILY